MSFRFIEIIVFVSRIQDHAIKCCEQTIIRQFLPPRTFHVHACVVRSVCAVHVCRVPCAGDDVYGEPQNGKFIQRKCLTKSNQFVVIRDSESDAERRTATMHLILCSRHPRNWTHKFPIRLHCQRIILCCHRLLPAIPFLAFYLRWHKLCQHFHGILPWKSAPRNFFVVLHPAEPSQAWRTQ